MAGESISIPILTPGADTAARNIKQVGDAAASTGGKLGFAAGSLEAFNRAAANSAKADATSVNALKAHAKAATLLTDAENVLAGKATTTTRLLADQGRQLDDTGGKAAKTAGAIGGLAGTGGIPGGGMGAAVAAGVALSGQLVTVGFGLGGLALAAAGVIKPIENAASATGGLQKNLHTLNPEQQAVARSILALGKQYDAFQKSLAPQVLTGFNDAIRIAGHVMGDVQPIAKATGNALDQVLLSIDKEFQSGTWQQFFGWMAANAGPDVKILGQNFTDLLQILPQLLRDLQPLGNELLHDTDAILRTADALEKAAHATGDFGQAIDQHLASGTGVSGVKSFGDLIGGLVTETGKLVPALHGILPGASDAKGFAEGMLLLGRNSGAAASGIKDAGTQAIVAHAPFFNLNAAVVTLSKSMTTLTGNLTTLQGSNVSWKQSMQAAETQLKSNTAGLDGNSKNALANKQAILQSTQAAISFAGQQLTLGKNIDGASRTVETQIKFLQGLHDKSAFVRSELAALRKEEALLQAQRINQTINVQGLGQWSVSQSLAPGSGHRRALGGLIPGHGSGDNYPALLTPGEVVVPKPMVSAGAVDHLRGSLPGFAAGGLVGKYAGSVSGLAPWIKRDDQATISLIDQSVVRATVAGIRAAAAAAATTGFGAPGPGGGAPAANAALAHRLYASQLTPASWAAWNAVAMAESGWNQFARNPSSGAYGIPQALPPGKMGAAANPPQSNPAAQINWMWNYMRASYGGPLGAEAHENAFHWYDRGGILKPGLTMAVNTTGHNERVLGPGQGGNTYIIHQHIPPNANKAELGRVTVEAIKEFERRSGPGWRS